MRRILISVFIVILFCGAVVHSENDWKLICGLSGGAVYVSRIHQEHGQFKRAWIKNEYKLSPDVTGALLGQAIHRLNRGDAQSIYLYKPEDSAIIAGAPLNTLTLREFDCAERKAHDLQTTTYFGDGSSLDVTDTEWHFTIPGSMGDTVLSYVCSH